MGANDKNVAINRLTAESKDETRSPVARLRSVRKLLRRSDFSVRSVALSKRVAKEFLENEGTTPEIRKSCLKLLDVVYAKKDEEQADEDETDETVVNGGSAKPAPVAVPTETREQELIRKNRHWSAEQVPAKWIYFFEYSDLAPYGIPDAVNDPRRLFVDSNDLISGPKRICNPLYIDSYRLWKQKRFPHGLPARDSVWRIRYEERHYVNACPGLLAKWPAEYPVGEECRRREHQRGEVATWEEPFAHELYYEILLGHRGQEFFVMFEIEGPDKAYFAARELERTAPPKPAVTEQRPLPETKMVCRACHNATRYTTAPIHDCTQYMEPEIFARIGAQHRAL